MPSTGEEAVQRSATKSANTLKGIKAMHQIQSTGEEGSVMTRSRSCHRCLGCRDQPTSRECIHNALCGEQRQVELSLKTAPSPALTRGALSVAGITMSQEANVGDYLAVELWREEHPFMIVKVVEGGTFQVLAEPETNWFGELKAGDAVLRVQCLKPVKPGSTSFYMETDGERGDQDVIAIFAEDVRYSNIVLDEDYSRNLRRRRTIHITTETHSNILRKLVLVKD